MSVRDSILALLSLQPRYGYELKQEFEERTSGNWTLNMGQVYTTLERLERDGLVVKGGEDEQRRIMYDITAAGREAASAWFATPVVDSRPPRNELAIKVALALTLPDVDVGRLLAEQRAATMTHLVQCQRALREVDADPARELLLHAMIFTAEAESRWLDYCDYNLPRLRAQTKDNA